MPAGIMRLLRQLIASSRPCRPIPLRMDLPWLLGSVLLESFLDQHRVHRLDHLWTAAQKYMSGFRARATTPSMLDRIAPP